MEEKQVTEKAGCIGICLSFIFPILGVLIYFVNKNNVVDPKTYLKAALWGFTIGFVLSIFVRIFATTGA